ncbi:SDR family NAD(P)-dependent oxidoreductase [Sphingobium sp. EP60837]|uniref:SDR family NAD(P)-dependent oxidoreductase n=1 Tax=Sphingobium sp. EP60837 TaxID=1855519 RepID=UPI0007DCF456|nr:SDR family oxidoreductase [Sphingobium sp. EP60837]ANI79233.1 3-oxoacyl-[acyl-carrier-protein] reductase [Sphingobium sp. EP60837]
MKKVALVTGATRGIGKVTALALAAQGFSVVVTGRTLQAGQGSVGDGEFVPGSIEETVAAIEAAGGVALGVKLDLLDRSSIDAALDATIAQFGRLDVLVNNAIYQGPGIMDRLADFTMQQAEDNFTGSVVNQMYISRQAIVHMARNGGGRIVFVTSGAAVMPPPVGAGLLYSASKAALNRIPGFINYEHGPDGIFAFLVEPQFTFTDSMEARWGSEAAATIGEGHPARRPEETAQTITWLVTHPSAGRFANGEMLNAPDFFEINDVAREP